MVLFTFKCYKDVWQKGTKAYGKICRKNQRKKFDDTKRFETGKSKVGTAIYHIFYVVSQSWNPCYSNPGVLHVLRFRSYKKVLGHT